MRSSDRTVLRAALAALALLAAQAAERVAHADPKPVTGFGTDRLVLAPTGSGWLTLDDLSMHGGLGGAAALTTTYARSPLHVPLPNGRLDVVHDQVLVDLGVALTYERFRVYASVTAPFLNKGTSGVSDGYAFSAPQLDPQSNPDTLQDVRVGFDARILGQAQSPFRLGASAELYVPSGVHPDYVTDGSVRAMGRVVAAGTVGPATGARFEYAAHLGVHIRPYDEPEPDGPHGSELLFAAAAGPRLSLAPSVAFVVGPEVYGETAFDRFFGLTTTGIEGLVSARVETIGAAGHPSVRVKAAIGGGIDPQFGTPDWRAVLSVEVTAHMPDTRAACPPPR